MVHASVEQPRRGKFGFTCAQATKSCSKSYLFLGENLKIFNAKKLVRPLDFTKKSVTYVDNIPKVSTLWNFLAPPPHPQM